MYSLNIPVPTAVATLAGELTRELPGARARPRGEHTLGVKRLGVGKDVAYSRLETQVRELLAGQPAFQVRVTSIEYFPDAPRGPSPVVYLAVDSPPLVELHRKLADIFEPIEGIEGEGYVPHVTVARGGSPEMATRLAQREIEPIRWDVTELVFWDAERNQPVSRLSLPA